MAELTDNDILNFAENIMNDRPTETATATNDVVVETPVVTETPSVVETQNEVPIEFVVSDEPKVDLQTTPVTPEATPTSETDFEKLYHERIAKEFGSDFDTVKSKLAQVSELEAKANSNVYKTEQGKIFDDLVSKGVPLETIVNVAFKDLSNADDLQILDYQMQLKYPTATAEERQAYLLDQYKQSEEFLDNEKLAGSFRLKQDASTARKELDSLKAQTLQSPVEKQANELQVKETKRIDEWKNGLTKKVVDSFNSLDKKVKLNLSFDGKPIEREAIVKVPISAKEKAEMESFVNEYLPQWTGATADADGQAFIKEVLQNKFIVNNIDKIIQSVANNALSFAVEQQKSYLHNYQPPRNNQSVTQGATGTTDADVLKYALDAYNS